jgi:hypothetical protein
MAVKIVWNKPGLDNVLQSPEGVVGRYLKKKGRLITAAARRQVGVRTGALRNSIHMRHFRDPRGQYIKVGSSLSYARAHHDGTKPHLIMPTKGQNLRFFSKGFLVFTQMVRHPGTKPNRYLTDNLRLLK